MMEQVHRRMGGAETPHPLGQLLQLLSLAAPWTGGLCTHPLYPHRCQGLHPCCGFGQGPYRCFEEAQGELRLQGTKGAVVWGAVSPAAAGPGLGFHSPRGAKKGPGPSPLPEEADLCPLSSSQIYNLGTGTGYSVLQMVQAMEKASGREVRSDSEPAGPPAQSQLLPHASLRHPKPSLPQQPLCLCLWQPLAPFPQLLGLRQVPSAGPQEPSDPTVLLSLQIKYKITGRREGDVASCYANPALAERELGWKAAFGLDKMCKSIPFPSTLYAVGCQPPGPPLTAVLPVAGEDLWRWQLQNPTGFSKN